MNAKKTGKGSPIQEYETLNPTSRTIIQILAVAVDYCPSEIVLRCLHELGIVDEHGRKFTLASLKQQEDKMQANGLILRSRQAISCSEAVQRRAVLDCLRDCSFSYLAKTLQKYLRLSATPPEIRYHANYQTLLADFQMSLFFHGSLGSIHDLLYRQVYGNFPNEFYDRNPLLALLNQPFSPDIFEKINPAIRLNILGDLLFAAEICTEPAEDIVNYLSNHHEKEVADTATSVRLLQYYMVKGDTASCRRLLSRISDDFKLEQISRTGWLEFLCGNYRESLTHFNNSIKLLKKWTGKRKIFHKGIAGIFYLLALLQDGETASLKEALDYIGIADKNDYPLAPLMTLMAPLFHERLGQAAPVSFVDDQLSYSRNPLNLLLLQLFSFWQDKEAGKNLTLLTATRDRVMKNGYPWLAAEFSALLAALGSDVEANSELAERLHAACGTRSFVGLVKHQPQWEKTLNALLHLNKAAADKKEASPQDQRIIWLFSHEEKYGYCHISPRLQKLTAQGKWSKGRPIALKTLYNDQHAMPGLTDQDRRVCRAVKEEYYRGGWGYGKTEYVIDREIALPALAGHPLLFLEAAPTVNVELVLAEPELHITEKKGKLELTVTPADISDTDNLVIARDTPTRFRIFRFTPEQKQLIGLLGEGVTIPRSAEKLARQAVEAVSGLITVHSDLAATGQVTSVPADSRPHAHILPYQDGISLEFLVKPVSDGGSSFTPGKGSKSVLVTTEEKTVQAVRDLDEEKRRLAAVIEACPTLNRLEETDNRRQAVEPEDSLELLLELKECGDKVVLEWPQGEKLKVRPHLSPKSFSLRIARDRDWFKATGSLQIDETASLDLRQLLDKLDRSTGRFIPLDDGTFLALTTTLRRRLSELQAFSESHGEGVRFAPPAALALEDVLRDVPQLKSDKAWKDHCNNLAVTATPRLPSTLRAKLREYQQTGFEWLARLSSWRIGACLADDMGLGKTVQALAAILLRASQGPTLVVAPLSVTSNWQEEASRFAPTLNVIMFGPGDRGEVIAGLQPFDLLIASYGLLPLEAELLQSVQWQTVILDEAQAIKNMQTKRSKAAMRLQAECRIITTGTPLENHLGELWTLFTFLNPGLLGSLKKFNEKFAIPIERDQDKEARNRLRKLIRPFILRRLKSDVLQELPAKTEITLEVAMSDEEQALYEAMRQKALKNIEAHSNEDAGQKHLRILAEIMKLRRLCCNPGLVLPGADVVSSKLQVFADTLHELLDNNHKALVFSQFVDHLGIIRDYLDSRGISYQYLDGSTPIAQRKERINAFQSGHGEVFLISLKAGGAGLNLTAADYVIHMDPWWNPAVEDQASDRAHRIGQDRPVTVYRLVMKDSIEQQIVDLHKQKRDLADSLLEGTDVAGKVSAAELLELLSAKC